MNHLVTILDAADIDHILTRIQGNYVGEYTETRRSEIANVLLTQHDDEDGAVIESGGHS